jgi:hypothetical protein
MQRTRDGILVIGILTIILAVSPAGALHIPTVNEGLLQDSGCYIGAYLGGNQGVDGPNYYRISRIDNTPYETQILDPGIPYGEINTGIDTFRSAAGSQHIIFSRYVDLVTAPYDNDYEKIIYVPSPNMPDWANDVCMNGGVPMIVLDPWAYIDSNGLLNLSVNVGDINDKTGMAAGDGRQHIIDFAQQLGQVSRDNADANGNATILVVFGQEFESHNEANPPDDMNTNGPNQQAFRQMFREAYTLFHTYATDDVQIVWAGNVADTAASKQWWWPGYDDNMNPLPADYVDWVGQTRYHFMFDQQLSDMTDYYTNYSVQKNHPFIFTETGADGGANTTLQLQLAEDWIGKLYNTSVLSTDFSNIKGIVWFNVAKTEQSMAKNFFIPDGTWINNGDQTPGVVQSASNPQNMMLPLYPDAVNTTYFTALIGDTEEPVTGSGVISGRVTAGSDIDAQGVPGAMVVIATRPGDLDDPMQRWQNTTDNRGVYYIGGLPDGTTLYASALPPQYASGRYYSRPVSYQVRRITTAREPVISPVPVSYQVPMYGSIITCPDFSSTPTISALSGGEQVVVDWYLVQKPMYFI